MFLIINNNYYLKVYLLPRPLCELWRPPRLETTDLD